MNLTRNPCEAVFQYNLMQLITNGRGYSPRIEVSPEKRENMTPEGIQEIIQRMKALDNWSKITPTQFPIAPSAFDEDRRWIYCYE